MTDEATPAPAAAETPSASEPVNLDAPVAEAPVQETVSEPDDSEEIEFDGEKYRVPKKLKDGFLMQRDYTQKTQKLAEHARQVQAQQAALQQQHALQNQYATEIGEVMGHNRRLAELQRVDWAKLESEDPFKAQSLHREYTQRRDHRDQLLFQISQKEQHRVAQQRQSFAAQYERTNQQLAKDIPNWSQEHATNLANFARSKGVSEHDLAQLAINPVHVKILNDAYVGEQLAKQRQEAAATAEPKVVVKPLTKVTGSGAKPAIDMAKADMDAFAPELLKRMNARR